LPQYFGPKNTGEDCELADKKKNDNRVLHDLLLYRPTPPFHYANHGHNLDKNIFMISHEITYLTYRKSSCVVQ